MEHELHENIPDPYEPGELREVIRGAIKSGPVPTIRRFPDIVEHREFD